MKVIIDFIYELLSSYPFNYIASTIGKINPLSFSVLSLITYYNSVAFQKLILLANFKYQCRLKIKN
jgi:hypothetical protein